MSSRHISTRRRTAIFIYARDETHYCTDLPPWVRKVNMLYYFKQGEATYCCAITPSSYIVPFYVDLDCDRDHPAYNEAEEDRLHENLSIGWDAAYVAYIDTQIPSPFICFHDHFKSTGNVILESGQDWSVCPDIAESVITNISYPPIC